jgi:hypothetical protein
MFRRLRPSHHRLAACLTLWAMALALLAPGVSRALAFASGQIAPWATICTAAGERRVAVAVDAEPAAPAGDMLQACALCVLGHDAPPLPVRAPAPVLLLQALADVPHLESPAPRAPPARLAAQPRAPPASFGSIHTV